MRCETVQRKLLGLEDPAGVPAELRAHLTRCATCREWRVHLLQLERSVVYLPVPRSEAKGEFLCQLLRDADTEAAVLTPPETDEGPEEVPIRLPGPAPLPRVKLVHARLVGAAAAVLLFLAAGWWLWAGRQEAPPEVQATPAPEGPLLASVIERDVRLAGAETPRQRYTILTHLAGDLHLEHQVLTHTSAGDELLTLEKLQELVLREGVQAQAEMLPAAERPPTPPPAASPVVPSDATERAQRFRQDCSLIQILVQTSLQLARREDPLERADLCYSLAERLAAELQRAADQREKARVRELGQYLRTLLEEGIAFNLSLARKAAPRNSAREDRLQGVSDRVRRLVQPLEEQLRRDATPQEEDDLQPTLRALRDGRQEIENALKGTGKRSP
jgi:hypothetical protein